VRSLELISLAWSADVRALSISSDVVSTSVVFAGVAAAVCVVLLFEPDGLELSLFKYR